METLGSVVVGVLVGAILITVALVVLVVVEILYAAYRRDLPWFDGYDPSGVFGESGQTLRIVALGDSTITGPGLTSPDDLWVRRLARDLSADYRVELTSLARGGATVGEVVAEQLPGALALEPHVVIVSAGGNDVIRRTPLRKVASAYQALFDALEGSGAEVVVVGLGDLGVVPRLVSPSDRLVSLAALRVEAALDDAVADRPRVHQVDIFDRSRELRGQVGMFAPDRFHPGVDVHAQVAAVVRAALDGEEIDVPGHGRRHGHDDEHPPRRRLSA